MAEVANLRVGNLDLGEHPRVRLHGKGDKWRTCPLWRQMAELLGALLRGFDDPATPETPVFSARGRPLTRFGMYKLVRRHAARFDDPRAGRRISPHVFRHTAAVHLLEASGSCTSDPDHPPGWLAGWLAGWVGKSSTGALCASIPNVADPMRSPGEP